MTKVKNIFQNSYFLAGLTAVLLRLSYPIFNLWILAWFAFVPLFLAVEQQRWVKTFLISFFCGALFFILTIFWLIHVTVSGMVVLSLYLGLYVVFFTLGYRFFKEKMTFGQRIFFVPCLWVSLEFVRGHLLTGFPWALLAYSQTFNLVVLQVADIFGAYGVSFIVMFVNVVLLEIIQSRKTKNSLTYLQIFIPLLILMGFLAYGAYRINENPKRSCPLKVAVIQGNIPQEIKWVFSFQETIFKKYRLLTEIVHLKDPSDLIIWPETSFPAYLEFGEKDKPLKQFIAQEDTPLLVGSIRLKDMRYFNSAILFSSSGEVLGFYDKLHLVPFGEYIPWRKLCPFLGHIVPIEDFTPGMNDTVFSVSGRTCPSIKFGVLICFEDIFSNLAVRFVRRGADFLINITNDAWFGDTSSPYQHMQASVFRAVENRVYVVRAANTGISCVLDDLGRPLVTVKDSKGKETFVTGYATSLVYKTGRASLYTKIGDAFAVVCILYAVVTIFFFLLRRKFEPSI